MPTNKILTCPHCGSKNVKAVAKFYRCKDCSNDFGRVALTDDGKLMIEEVKGLRFRYSDGLDQSAYLRIAEDQDSCVYEVYDAKDGGWNKFADVYPMNKWMNMKEKMFNEMYLADWERTYLPVNDGQQEMKNISWELTVIVNEEEELTFAGYDAYPAYWPSMMKVLSPFYNPLRKMSKK